ncbi:MAG: DUF4153 domain-containing protein [Tissierellia bacterium]|nr:DUF4153 domain-containing protein [Tissierellia bacterium]
MVLIPLVAMQMVSSYIRIEAYGITESRYYVVLFGIFSIVCALMLIFGKRKNTNMIVLLSSIFALISIIPPVDAFSISKNSQQNRLEDILIRNNMLVNNEIVKKSDISNDDKFEITNISNYMNGMGYLDDMPWYPLKDNENYYANFKNTYGFEQYYDRGYPIDEETVYLSVMLNSNEIINIEGFDMFFKINIYNNSSSPVEVGEFKLNNKDYKILQHSDTNGDLTIMINQGDLTIMEIPMMEFIDELYENANESKAMMAQEELTIEKQNEDIKIKLLINSLYVDRSNSSEIYINGDAYIFVAQ